MKVHISHLDQVGAFSLESSNFVLEIKVRPRLAERSAWPRSDAPYPYRRRSAFNYVLLPLRFVQSAYPLIRVSCCHCYREEICLNI